MVVNIDVKKEVDKAGLGQESQVNPIQLAPLRVIRFYDEEEDSLKVVYERLVPHFVCRDFATDYLVAAKHNIPMSIYGFDATSVGEAGTDKEGEVCHNYVSVGFKGNTEVKTRFIRNFRTLSKIATVIFGDSMRLIENVKGGRKDYDEFIVKLPMRCTTATPLYSLGFALLRWGASAPSFRSMGVTKTPDLVPTALRVIKDTGELGNNDKKLVDLLITMEGKLPMFTKALGMNADYVFGSNVVPWDWEKFNTKDLNKGVEIEGMAIGSGAIHNSMGIYTFLVGVKKILEGEQRPNAVVKHSAERFAEALKEVI